MRKKDLLQLGPCPQCGTHFVSRYVKTFCCMKCYTDSPAFKARMQEANNRKRLAARGTLGYNNKCLQCGVEFMSKSSSKAKFCSRNHYRAYFAARFDRWIASPQGIALPQAYDEFLTQEELPCLVEGCDWQGHHLGAHLNFAHGIRAEDFKAAAGFNKTTGLVSPTVSAALAARPHLAFASIPEEYRGGHNSPKGRTLSLEAKEHHAKARIEAGENGQKPTRECRGCGVQFQQESYYGLTAYCSVECRSRYYDRMQPVVTLPCAECGTPFQTQKRGQQLRNRKGLPVFCSFHCRQVNNTRYRWPASAGVETSPTD